MVQGDRSSWPPDFKDLISYLSISYSERKSGGEHTLVRKCRWEHSRYRGGGGYDKEAVSQQCLWGGIGTISEGDQSEHTLCNCRHVSKVTFFWEEQEVRGSNEFCFVRQICTMPSLLSEEQKLCDTKTEISVGRCLHLCSHKPEQSRQTPLTLSL